MSGKEHEIIVRLLESLGITPNSGGGSYISYGIKLCIKNNAYEYNITDLYSAIAHDHMRSVSTVEREIRNAVRTAWKERDSECWRQVFITSRTFDERPPTNSLFITAVAECVKMRLLTA